MLETVDINESKDYAHFAKYFTYVIAFASHNNNMDEGIFNQFYTSNIWGWKHGFPTTTVNKQWSLDLNPNLYLQSQFENPARDEGEDISDN